MTAFGPTKTHKQIDCQTRMTDAKKLDVYSATSEYSKTYVFHEEDHTLGNALRYVLMRKYVLCSLLQSPKQLLLCGSMANATLLVSV